jgi:hypothetical protein
MHGPSIAAKLCGALMPTSLSHRGGLHPDKAAKVGFSSISIHVHSSSAFISQQVKLSLSRAGISKEALEVRCTGVAALLKARPSATLYAAFCSKVIGSREREGTACLMNKCLPSTGFLKKQPSIHKLFLSWTDGTGSLGDRKHFGTWTKVGCD